MFSDILNDKSVSIEDIMKLVGVVAYTQDQIQELAYTPNRGPGEMKSMYLFPKNGDNDIQVIKSVLSKYGVKTDVGVSAHYGNKKVVRVKIENAKQDDQYHSFGKLLVWNILTFAGNPVVVQTKDVNVPFNVAETNQKHR